jgi:hypothetical protein
MYLELWQSEPAEIFHTASQHVRDRFPHEKGPYCCEERDNTMSDR